MRTPLSRMTAYQLRRVAESFLGLAEGLFARHLDIRVQEWRVLAKLQDSPGSIATEIGRDMLLSPVQTGRSLLKLHQLGLVQAAPDPDDRRATRYTLTPAGARQCDAGMRIVQQVQARALRDFSAVERIALDSLLARMVRNSHYGPQDVQALSAQLAADGKG